MNDQKLAAKRDPAAKPLRGAGLALTELVRKRPNDQRSSDPYNTSGSFDRTKNWESVGRR